MPSTKRFFIPLLIFSFCIWQQTKTTRQATVIIPTSPVGLKITNPATGGVTKAKSRKPLAPANSPQGLKASPLYVKNMLEKHHNVDLVREFLKKQGLSITNNDIKKIIDRKLSRTHRAPNKFQ